MDQGCSKVFQIEGYQPEKGRHTRRQNSETRARPKRTIRALLKPPPLVTRSQRDNFVQANRRRDAGKPFLCLAILMKKLSVLKAALAPPLPNYSSHRNEGKPAWFVRQHLKLEFRAVNAEVVKKLLYHTSDSLSPGQPPHSSLKC